MITIRFPSLRAVSTMVFSRDILIVGMGAVVCFMSTSATNTTTDLLVALTCVMTKALASVTTFYVQLIVYSAGFHTIVINSSLKQYSQNLLFLAHKKFPSKDRAFQMVSKVRSHWYLQNDAKIKSNGPCVLEIWAKMRVKIALLSVTFIFPRVTLPSITQKVRLLKGLKRF